MRKSKRELTRAVDGLDPAPREQDVELSSERAADIRALFLWRRELRRQLSRQQLGALLEQAYRDGVAEGEVDSEALDAAAGAVGIDVEADS